jgi:hypothetical protein
MKESELLDPIASHETFWRRREAILCSIFLFLLVGLAFLVRLWGLSKMHFWDETVYLQNAEVICCGKTNYSELASRPPLLSLFYALLFRFWHHIYAACIATDLVNAAGPALLFAAGRKIAGAIPAALAALLLAFLPFFVGVIPGNFDWDSTGNSLLSDCPALTLILLVFWLLLRALERETSLRFASAGVVMALAVLMRFPSLSSVGMIGLLTLMAKRRWRAVAACAGGFAIGFAPYLCWSRMAYGGFLTTLREGWSNFDGPGESPFYYLKIYGNTFAWITLAGLLLWIANRAWEIWKGKGTDHRDGPDASAAGGNARKLEWFLWLWAVVLLVFFSTMHHKEPRYAIPLAPPLFLLAGIGLSTLVKGRGKALRVAGIAVLAGGLAYAFLPTIQMIFQTPFLDEEVNDTMQASEYLDHNLPPATILYATVDYPDFAYYSNLKISPVTGAGAELYKALEHLSADGVYVAYKDSDKVGGPRLDWLDANPHFQRFYEFPSLVLYHYRAGNIPK